MRIFFGWLILASIAVASLSVNECSFGGVVVSLNPTTGLGTPISAGNLHNLNFQLPSDIASINSVSLSYTYADSTVGANIGLASLDVFFPQEAPGAGASIFGISQVDSIAFNSSDTINSGTFTIGSSGVQLDSQLANNTFSPQTLDPVGWWVSASSSPHPFLIYFYNDAMGGSTTVKPAITSATLTINYNSTNANQVPEPTTFAMAIMGIATWAGRRVLRTHSSRI
jgi:hypothetical protein